MAKSSDLRDVAAAARAVKRELARARAVGVVTHERPDGDAIGSIMALASILKAAGHRAVAVCADDVPRRFAFLKGLKNIVRPPAVRRRPDLVFSLDATDPFRHGAARELVEAAERVIVIDHHPSNERFGDLNWVDSGACAVGEMIHTLAARCAWRVPRDAAEALYVAIMTDTGRFTFSNTTAHSFAVASELVAGGVDPGRVAEGVYSGRPLGEWELEARLRSSLRMEDGGRIATVELTIDDFRRTRTTPAAAQDFASLSRTLEGVKIGVFFYEIDGGRRTKVGLRSARGVDVNALAARFGGGGHTQASGCMIEGGLAEAKRVVLREAKKHLRARGPKRKRG